MPPAAILDVDGTLVDTNYQHVLAWFRAFRQNGLVVPLWRLHRHVGMGGDQYVAAIAGEDFDGEHGDDVRAAHDALYLATIDEVELLPGAVELLRELKGRGHTVVLASSAKETELEHYLELLDARNVVDDWTSSADVESTKPAPDLVAVARDKAGGGSAVLVGDTPWDIRAAERAGVPTVAVLTGGFAREELAGAVAVFDGLPELIEQLGETPLGG
jgi:HAD superfamily hydrolase (TIGR01509 family)